MKQLPFLQFHVRTAFTRCTGILLWLIAGLSLSSAATITMTADDTGSDNSFTGASHWSNALAPTAGNAYYSAKLIRTPAAAGDYTFAGDSLTLDTFGGGLVYKGTGGTITVNNLSMNNKALITNFASAFTLAGTITLGTTATSYFRTDTNNQGFTITAAIQGAGSLTFSNGQTALAVNQMILASAHNTYSGGTTIAAYTNVAVRADGAIGTGNLIMSGGKLTLELATTNDYIADTATFSIATGLADGSVNLNFTGADAVAKLSIDGGTTFLAAGLYDATTLNSLYGSNAFTGTGAITVVPEPATAWLLGAGVMLFVVCRRRSLQGIRSICD